MGLSLLRKEALYPPRALFAQIGAGAVTIPVVVSKDPIPMEWWSFFQGKRGRCPIVSSCFVNDGAFQPTVRQFDSFRSVDATQYYV